MPAFADIDITKTLSGPDGPMALHVGLSLEPQEFITLFGPSGAGKTSVLRMVAGLMEPDEGRIVVDGEPWFDSTTHVSLPPNRRLAGLVFQDYALFPHMTVRQNLEYALPRGGISKEVSELLHLAGLDDLADRLPHSLSGGQKQRVALARALARKPRLLLLDEPLSALDPAMRSRLQDVVLDFHRQLGVTTILVSHTPAEIFKLSQRVYMLDGGRITRVGLPGEVFIGKKTSGKFKFEGEILAIERDDVVVIVTIGIGNNVVKVVASERDLGTLAVGSRVVVASKAFNPILYPTDLGE
jgi:molybdate transport system ATP-binding protein